MYFKAGDVISGKEGTATVEINGQVETLFVAKQIEATAEKSKTEINVIGHRGTQHKTVGWSGSGSMTLFYATSLFRKLMADYITTGVDTYFTLTLTNNDPTTSVGAQTVALYNCNLDSTVMGKIDVDNTELDEDLDFTFDDVALLEEFKAPVLAE
jgi:hypothetical protein